MNEYFYIDRERGLICLKEAERAAAINGGQMPTAFPEAVYWRHMEFIVAREREKVNHAASV